MAPIIIGNQTKIFKDRLFKTRKLSAIITFLNFSKTSSNIHLGKMLKIQRAYGILEELIVTTGKTYENDRIQILSVDGETEFFYILMRYNLMPYVFP